ncbi:DUF3810 domain-containing protein [Sediminibacterium ginsengisoli]|uniref:DUF3810 domain-containing protein n=1 Tax=Sediminibacterium ginsengisoli TaxID=413434 RepID=A0A1T4LJK3_9BACT|nr:DUF3810 domain-containing protein [Sediminibacterium ginsengisoli]SJZ54614.1 Protein of unknown function [Sediminibacterium ginsengisoli]
MKTPAKLTAFVFVKPAFRLIIAFCIFLFSFFPRRVEEWYSSGIYPGISNTLRLITRWFPFSVGDCLYVLFIIWLLYGLFKLIRRIVKRKFIKADLLYLGLRLLSGLAGIYIVFKLTWGLNYDRLGIAYQLNLTDHAYTKEEVTVLTDLLIDKLNECRREIGDSALQSRPLDSLYREAYRSYETVSVRYPFLTYTNRSVKASLFTPLTDYAGITGYYNPFSGEAQLRTDLPRILIPYIACHEMAHQLGYASESEANFVGYLAAVSSKDAYFRYSAYLDLFSYAQGEQLALYSQGNDFKQFEQVLANNRNRLDTLVKKDRRMIRDFFNRRRKKSVPAFSSLYDQYLKMNKQSSGVDSYNEVVGWLIAYNRKYGRL